MARSRNTGYKLRYQILQRDNFTCKLCGKTGAVTILEVDHIIPVADGGTDDPENLRTTCYACNRGRGTLIQKFHKHEKNKFVLEDELLKLIKRWKSYPEWDLLKKANPIQVKNALHKLWDKGLVYRDEDGFGNYDWFYIDKYSNTKTKTKS